MIALGIGIATVAAFFLSFVYYAIAPAGVSSDADAAARRPKVWQLGVEVARSLAIAGLVAGLLTFGGWQGAGPGALLALALFVIPLVLLVGSVVHEGTPIRSAAVHAGDWLLKLVAIGAIVGPFV